MQNRRRESEGRGWGLLSGCRAILNSKLGAAWRQGVCFREGRIGRVKKAAGWKGAALGRDGDIPIPSVLIVSA